MEEEAAGDNTLDDVDKVTAAVLKDRLGVELAKHERGENYRDLNNIASPIQSIRDTLNLTPKRHMQSRLAAVPAALEGYKESLTLAASQGNVAAIRQINEVITQCIDLAKDGSMLGATGRRQARAGSPTSTGRIRGIRGLAETRTRTPSPHRRRCGAGTLRVVFPRVRWCPRGP